MSKILSLDQSTRITGWSVFDGEELVAYGKWALDSSIPIAKRLMTIRNKVAELVHKYEIETLVLEDIQLQNNVVNNVQTFKALAEVFGVITEYCEEINLPWSAVLASSWKHTLGIRGANRTAQKKNAQEYIIKTFNIKPTQDECDSICIGLHYVKNEKGFDWS